MACVSASALPRCRPARISTCQGLIPLVSLQIRAFRCVLALHTAAQASHSLAWLIDRCTVSVALQAVQVC